MRARRRAIISRVVRFSCVCGDRLELMRWAEGFHYKPGIAWPPLKGDGIRVVIEEGQEPILLDEQIQARLSPFYETDSATDESLQMYCPNTLLTHPLISLVNQGSLGGLPPLMIVSRPSQPHAVSHSPKLSARRLL